MASFLSAVLPSLLILPDERKALGGMQVMAQEDENT